MAVWHFFSDSRLLPSEPGVYAIFHDRTLVYIGQSENLRDRMAGHRRNRENRKFRILEPGDSILVTIKARVVRQRGDWMRREYRLLQRLRPPLNRRMPLRTLEDRLLAWAKKAHDRQYYASKFAVSKQRERWTNERQRKYTANSFGSRKKHVFTEALENFNE